MNRQITSVSGTPFDDVLDSADVKYQIAYMPYLGQEMKFADGRKFRFVSSETDLVAGEMVCPRITASAEFNGKLTAASAGAESVILDITGVNMYSQGSGVMAKDALAEGYIHMTDDAGEGYTYQIKGNTATVAPATSITISLYTPLQVSVTTATDCNLTSEIYRKVDEGNATTKSLGCVMKPVTGASDGKEYFFWIQTRGPATCLGSCTQGVQVAAAASGAVADSAEAGSGAYDQIVGTGLATTSDGYAVVYLTLE